MNLQYLRHKLKKKKKTAGTIYACMQCIRDIQHLKEGILVVVDAEISDLSALCPCNYDVCFTFKTAQYLAVHISVY